MKNTAEFESLSNEAKAIAGAYWGNGMMSDRLSFKRPWVISHKARKALDDLVEAGYLTVATLNDHPKSPMEWQPTSKMRSERPTVSAAFLKEHGKFPMLDESLPEPALPKRRRGNK